MSGADGVTGAACPLVREALSAGADGEDPSLGPGAVATHLAVCGPCAAFAAGLTALNRRLRVRLEGPVPALGAVALAGIAHRRRVHRRRLAARVATLALLAAAVPAGALAAAARPLPARPARAARTAPCTARLAGHRPGRTPSLVVAPAPRPW